MSRTIDERVITLKFDNAQFEHNIKTSIDSLGKFEKATKLDGATKGIEEVEQAVKKLDFSVMLGGVVKVEKGISRLKEVAKGALRSIGDFAMMEFAPNLIKSMSGIETLYEGYGKYEQKTKSVQTLLNSTGRNLQDINGYLDTLMRFSDETSYGFSEMAGSLAQLTSSGGDIEKLVPMITGIANAVAFAGKGPAEFSRAIYNLNQSYGAGALKYMDWKSLELAGVASKDLKQSFIETAKELGKLNKLGATAKGNIVDIGNFSESLKDGWADTTVMEQTFGKFAKYTQMADQMVREGKYDTYSEAYKFLASQYDDIYIKAAKAAQEATTFNEAITATKDAVSSKWLKTFELFFGDIDIARKTWTNLANDLYDIFAVPGDIRNDVLSKVFRSNYDQLRDILEEAGVDFSDYDSKFKDFLKNSGWNVDELVKQYGSLSAALAHGNVTIEHISGQTRTSLSNLFGDFTQNYVKKLKGSVDDASSAVDKLSHIQKIYNDIWSGKYGNGDERIEKLAKAGIDYTTMQYEIINKMAEAGHRGGYELTIKDIEHLTAEQWKALGVTEAESEAIKDLIAQLDDADAPLSQLLNQLDRVDGQVLLSESITNVTGTIKNLQKIVSELWKNLFGWNFADIIYNVVLKIHDFTQAIKEATGNAAIIEKIKTIAPIIKSAFGSLDRLGNSILTLFKTIKTGIVDTVVRLASPALEKFKNWISGLLPVFDSAKTDISGFIDRLSDGVDRLTEWVKNSALFTGDFSLLSNSINDALSSAKNWVGQFVDLDKLGSIFKNALSSIKEWIGQFIDLERISSYIKGILEDIKNGLFFDKIISDLKKLPNLIINAFKNFNFNTLIGGIKNIPTVLSNAFKKIKSIKFTAALKNIDLKGFVRNIIEKIREIPNTIASVFANLKKIDLSQYFNFDFFNSEAFINTIKGSPILSAIAGLGIALTNVLKSIYDIIIEGIKKIYPIIAPYLNEFKDKVVDLSKIIIEAANKAVDWIRENNIILEAVEKGAEFIGKTITKVKDWISKFVQIESVSKNLSGILKNISSFSFENLSFKNVQANASQFFSFLGSKIDGLKDNKFDINDILSPNGIYDALSSITGNVKGGFDGFLNTIESAIKKMDIDWDSLGAIMTKARKTLETGAGLLTGFLLVNGISNAMTGIGKVLNGLLMPINTINDVLKAFAGAGNQASMTIAQVGTSISGYFTQLTNNVKTENILKIAIAITILTTALFVLAKIDLVSLGASIAAVGVLLLFIALFNDKISKTSSAMANVPDKNVTRFAGLLVGLAAAMVILSIALRNFEKLRDIPKSALVAIGSMVALVVAMGALMRIMKKYGDKDTTISAGFIIAFAASMYIMGLAMQKFASLKFDDIASAAVGFTGAIVMMWVAMSALKGLKAGSALPVLSIVGTLFLLIKAMDIFANMDVNKTINAILNVTVGLISAVPLLITLVIAMKLLNAASTNFTGMAAYTISLVASIWIFARAIESLGKIDTTVLLKGGGAVSALMIVMGILSAFIAYMATKNPAAQAPGAWKNIAAMGVLISGISLSLYLLAGAVLVFKNMEIEELAKGIGSISVLLLAIGKMLGLMGTGLGAANMQSAKVLASLVTIIALVAGAVFALSFLDTERLIASVSSMVILMGALAGVVVVISKLATTDWGLILSALGSMVLVLAIAGGAIWGLTSVIKDPSAVLPIAQGLTEVILAISAAILALSIAGELASVSVATIGPILATLGGLVAAITVISAIAALATDINQDELDRFVMFMKGFGDALGSFAGSLIENIGGGLIATIANGLERIGASIAGFIESIQPLFDMEKPADFAEKIAAVGSVIDIFGGKTFINSIKTLGLNNNLNFDKVGQFFSSFAVVINNFSDSIKTINPSRLNSAASIGEMFSSLTASMGRSGGFIDLIIGKKTTLKDFAEGMETYASALVSMSNILTKGEDGEGGFDEGSVKIATDAGNAMRELEKGLGSHDGLLQKIIGENSIEDFGERIKAFAQGLVDMSTTLIGFDPESLKAAEDAGYALSKLEQGVNSSKSLLGLIKGGEGNLSDFGNRIKGFAEGLKTGLSALLDIGNTTNVSYDNIDNVIPDSSAARDMKASITENRFALLSDVIDNTILLAKKFMELETQIAPGEGAFTGGDNLKKLGGGISSFTTSFKKFTENFPTEIPDIEEVKKAIGISELFADLGNEEGVAEADAGLASLGEKISSWGTSIKDMFNNVINGDVEETEDEAGSSLGGGLMGIIGRLFKNEQLDEQAVEGAKQTATSYLSSLSDVMGEKSEPMKAAKTSFSTAAAYLAKWFEFTDGAGKAEHSKYYDVYFSYGANYIQGLIDGMESRAPALYEKAHEIANTVASIIPMDWMEASPSKLTYKYGTYFIQGLANGINDMTDSAVTTAGSAASQITTAVQEALNTSDDILNSQYNPVISPVLDTTNILDGANTINSLLSDEEQYNAALGITSARAGIQNSDKTGSPVNVSVNFTVNNGGRDLTEADVTAYSRRIANEINILLGNAI